MHEHYCSIFIRASVKVLFKEDEELRKSRDFESYCDEILQVATNIINEGTRFPTFIDDNQFAIVQFLCKLNKNLLSLFN